jgi:predicted Zn-dependent protease
MSLKLKAVNNLANVFTDTKYPGRSLEKAAQLYTVAIQSAERPNLTYELRINLAQTYYQMGRQQEALRMVNEVYKELKSDPDSRNIWLIPFIEKMLAGPPKG